MWKELQSIRLSFVLARAEHALRNEKTFLGIGFSALLPLFTFVVLFVIFSENIGKAISLYPLYLLLGIIMFNLFRQATVEATRALYNHRLIIKSINFPKSAVIGSVMLRSLMMHAVELLVFVVFLLYFDALSVTGALYLLLLGVFILFTLGVSLALATISVYFMDLEHLWAVAAQALWFATPIFYALQENTVIYALNQANPLYYFITIARDLVIYHTMPQSWMVGGALAYTGGALFVGSLSYSFFHKRFAERF